MKRFFTAKHLFLLLLFHCVTLFSHAQLRMIPREPTDLFIFYSTSPGGIASDGVGRNSPFAEAFLNNIQKDEPINLLAIDIVSDTLKLTAQRQRPSYDSQIVNNKMFSIANRNSAKKYALLIGNDKYSGLYESKNAANDVQDIAAVLLRLGYEVVLKIDASQSEMESAINSFTAKLKSEKESEGFFWFAGMGVNLDGENYLVPVNANLSSESLVRVSSFPLYTFTENLQSIGNKINVVCLDAGRNPYMGETTR
jgi:uncharacterized caspase-like protein